MVLTMQGIATLNYQPLTGIQQAPAMHHAAKILADMGREEDTYIVHAAEGETVIPMEVMEANPKMAEMIYEQLRDMGLDPERYVVGSELNSINPTTGMPEFFLKKLWRGIKKVAKVVLPIVATVALASMGVPVPIASGIVSGTNTMIQGGSFKDGLKSAAQGFVVGSIAQGVAAGVNAPAGSTMGERFSTGFDSIGRSVTSPFTAQPEAFTQAAGSATGSAAATDPSASVTGQFTDTGLSSVDALATPPSTGLTNPLTGTAPPLDSAPVLGAAPSTSGFTLGDATSTAAMPPAPAGFQVDSSLTTPAVDPFASTASTTAATDKNFLDKTADFYKENISPSRTLPEGASVLRQYAPIAGLGTLGVAAMGGFEEQPLDLGSVEAEFATTGEDLLEQQPEMYGYNYADFVGRNPYFQRGQGSQAPGALVPPVYSSPVVATPMATGISSPAVLANTPMAVAYSAGGGAINGPGTGTSDSIPAMLSDGEFVFTAKAVRGAGNGDRMRGAKEMYRTMKRLEGMA